MSIPEKPERRPEPVIRPEVRIGNREREQAVIHLGTAFSEGRLDLEEYDERIASAYGAKTASDLLGLTADLPVPHEQPPLAGRVERHRPKRESALDCAQPTANLPDPGCGEPGWPTRAWSRSTW
ncbi:MAG: DUF1707 domain-containing protein [Geodermatophilaceae bacterium]